MDKTGKITCNYAHITDVGCVRELNEDSLYCGENLWLVADGMGGHACGEIASKLAADTIADEFAETEQLNAPIQSAHKKILQAAENGVGQAGMGTTVVAVTSNDNDFEVAWVGDSRAYLWSGKRLRLTQLTEDHSLIVRLVKTGLITKEDAKTHPQRHMITQCLGSTEIKEPQIDSCAHRWLPEQQILLCSDGLSDDVSEAEISEILTLEVDNQQKLEKLVAIAKEKGGRDNISLILIDSPVQAKSSIWGKFKQFFVN